jgi:5-methylcytosine-specific restriction endonuclease McrA
MRAASLANWHKKTDNEKRVHTAKWRDYMREYGRMHRPAPKAKEVLQEGLKRCTKCNDVKTIDSFRFDAYRSRVNAACRVCMARIASERHKRTRGPYVERRQPGTCIVCGSTYRPFRKRKKALGGISTRCVGCEPKKQPKPRAIKPQRMYACAVCGSDGPFSKNQRLKFSRAPKCVACARRYALPRDKSASARLSNRLKVARRRARHTVPDNRIETVRVADLKAILVGQMHRCAMCRVDLRKVGYHLDHYMPLGGDGTHTRDNLQALCADCNIKKGAMHPIDFAQSLGQLL